MKTFDFTKPHGLGLTQEDLSFLQTAWQELLVPMVGMGGNGATATVISGMVVSIAGSNVTVTDGWFVYNGEMIKFTGSTVTLGAGEVAVALIATNNATTPLPYGDSSTPVVRLDKMATLTHAATVTDSTHFPVTDAHSFPAMTEWLLPSGIEARPHFQGDIITFRNNKTIIYAALDTSGGIPTYSLDFSGAVNGAEVTVNVPAPSPFGGTYHITFGSSGGGTLVFTNDVTALFANEKNTMRFRYLGTTGGNSYVHFESWQYT